MRIVLAGGGTGGHIYPALAVARYIKSKEPESEILFVGTKKGLESSIVPSAGFELETITVRGLPRKLSPELFKTFTDLTRGGIEARKVLKDFKPQVVLGTGGYVCGPVVSWSYLLGIPGLIHEQNVIPGITNKILSRFTEKICVSFEASKKYFRDSDRVVVTGNPRASEVVGASREEGIKSLMLNPNKKSILIVSGSRGAEKINDCILEILPYLKVCEDIQFVYITGQKYYDNIISSAKNNEIINADNIFLKPYLEEMPVALAVADLIISRAGATTLSEITARGIPSILIPSPNVTNNHQVLNARVLSDAGAAELIVEDKLTGKILAEKVLKIINDNKKLENMARRSKELGRPDSNEVMFNLMKNLIN